MSKLCVLNILVGLLLMVSLEDAFSQPRSSGRKPTSIGGATLDSRANQQVYDPSSFDPQNSRQITPAGAAFLTSAPPHVGGPPPPPPPPVPIDGAIWILILVGAGLGVHQMKRQIRLKVAELFR